MRDLLLAHRPVKWPAVFAVDASTWDRCDGRDLARAGLLLLGVQAFGRAADRGRLVLPVDHPARLGPAIPGPHRCTPHASRPPATPQRPPSTRSAGSSNACPTMGRCRCSSSTPATTPRLVTWRELVAATRRRAYADEPYWRRPATVRGQPRCRENRKCQDLVRICGPVSAEMLIGLGRGRREPFLNAARAGQPRRVTRPCGRSAPEPGVRSRRNRGYLMNPSDRIHSWATARGFFPSTLTCLFRAESFSVVSLSAIGLNSASRPGYFLATSLRREIAGL